MPEFEPIDAQFRKIKRRFDDDPKDWRVLSDIDARGNKDMFINQRGDLWQIKTKPLSPMTGVARSCHVRNLDEDIQREIHARGVDGEKFLFSLMIPQARNEALFAAGIESFTNSKSKRLKEMIGEKEKNLEKKLADDVEKTFEKQHAQRRNMFM
ncbi:MAG: hypothetical protein GYA24_07335 [Candidatus Lokiarchaeota archaeon]|nr:hypothetical protein [Candidatus Lokiarchaeota archaeon]